MEFICTRRPHRSSSIIIPDDILLVVLEGSGQPTCCTFSGTQTYIIVSGTTEGTIHMWDLRESNTLHTNRLITLVSFFNRIRDTIDLRIAKGLRKPCYSTQTLTISNSLEYAAYAATLKVSETSDVEWDQHSCPIVQVGYMSLFLLKKI